MNGWRIIITYSAEKEAFVARAPELRECETVAATRSEAITLLEGEIEDRVANMKAQGLDIPQPLDQQELDGKLEVEISPGLHRDLLFMAKSAEVELPVLLTEILTRAVSYRGRPRGKQQRDGHRGRREGQGQRYHDIMGNRADFIDYVRRLDQGGGQQGGRGGGRGPQGGGRRGKR